ncbi:MAG: hypothetical protein AAFV53_40655 [Myxococcota bacterium]
MHRLSSLFLLSLTGCDMVEELLGSSAPDLSGAETQLSSGDLPGAAAVYQEAAKSAPTNVDAATGAAYTYLLAGDHAAADAALAAAEAEAGERLGEIKARRALIALEQGKTEKIKSLGEASGTDVGRLLAAEAHLADGEREEAIVLLEQVSGGGPVGRTAKEYLSLVKDPDPVVSGLSEVAALWAIGDRKIAVRSVEELIKNLPDTREDQDELLILWAGRAASVRETEVARRLLEAATFPPQGQAWRKFATAAIIDCADNKPNRCVEQLNKLEGNAPADGLADARATAAVLIAPQNADVARRLADAAGTNAGARALLEAGDRAGARKAATGVMGSYLKSGG